MSKIKKSPQLKRNKVRIKSSKCTVPKSQLWNNQKKGSWSKTEDQLLIKAKKENPNELWSIISQFVPGRNSKQCNERYKNVLDPNINRSPFCEKEIELIIEKQKIYGNSWKKIVIYFDRRTENMIKNLWYSEKRKANRKRKKKFKNDGQIYENKLERVKKKPNEKNNNKIRIVYPKLRKYTKKSSQVKFKTKKRKYRKKKHHSKKIGKKKNKKIIKKKNNEIEIKKHIKQIQTQTQTQKSLNKKVTKNKKFHNQIIQGNHLSKDQEIIENEDTLLLNDLNFEQDNFDDIIKTASNLDLKQTNDSDKFFFDFQFNTLPFEWLIQDEIEHGENYSFQDYLQTSFSVH
ncbi:myb protein-related [Anaeramoeba flamelloides]|uniref:Myb protein-related n=1 Tax=Anaeramoeba flamelloides TaxID=1746091 RepID=A0AAV7Y5G8_9EUKA|nr:myb protein-related [Anaeramoeba flamelloides]